MLSVDEYGLFIGEVSMPYQNGMNFYERNVQSIFQGMHKSLFRTDSDVTGKQFCYMPQAYCMLGNYDITTLSIVDDFHFGAKYFHPYSFLNETEDSDPTDKKIFNYHVTMGTYSYLTEAKGFENLVSKCQSTFLKEDERYPFIGVTNIKVKNSLLIGGGIEIISICIHALKKRLSLYGQNVGQFEFIVIEPISWNEISIIFFSNCMKKISDALILVREMTVEFAVNESITAGFIDNDDIVQKTLLYLKTETSKSQILNSHLFTHTFSNLGIDLQWLKLVDETQEPYVVNKYLNAIYPTDFKNFTRWFIKPAYLEVFLKENNITDKFNWVIGNGDVELEELPESVFNSLIKDLKSFLFKEKDGQIEEVVRKTKTIPKFAYTVKAVNSISKEYLDGEISDAQKQRVSEFKAGLVEIDSLEKRSPKHLTVTLLLNELAFKKIEIKSLRQALIKLQISKTLRERIISAFINFNDCIQDPILYIIFIDLRHYLETFFDAIIKDSKNGSPVNKDALQTNYALHINSFDQAYKTNIVHSYRLYNVTEFNLEYNGGIQTIMSGFDALFKYFRHRIYDRKKYPFISIVSGDHAIQTKMNSLFVNYNHLFSPEFLLAALPKESVNHYFFNSPIINESQRAPVKNIINLYKAGEFAKAERKFKEFRGSSDEPSGTINAALIILDLAQEAVTVSFKNKIFEKIISGKEENKSLFLEYLEATNKDTIAYFLEDTFAAWVLPAKDYIFWLLATFSQESSSYNVDGTFNEKFLVRLLFRLSLIQMYDSTEDYTKYVTFPEVNTEQIKYHQLKISEFVALINNLDILPGVTIWKLRRKMYSINAKMYDRKSDLAVNVEAETDSYIITYKESLRNGRISKIKLNDSYASIRAIIISYLDVIRELYSGKYSILRRRAEDGYPDFTEGQYYYKLQNVLLLDPAGGNFTIGVDLRLKYFKIRATLIRSLFDFSLKQKVQLFDK